MPGLLKGRNVLKNLVRLHAMPDSKSYKVVASVLEHVYSQIVTAISASLFCACVVFAGLYRASDDNSALWLWMSIFVGITVVRFGIYFFYRRSQNADIHHALWRNFYIVGSFLGGVVWGGLAWFFFPEATPVEQILLVLMLSGVSAGAVPLSAAIPQASLAFLLSSVFPLFLVIIVSRDAAYYLFDTAIAAYLVYMIAMTFKTRRLILDSIILKYENDILLNNLAISNRFLETAATHDPLTNLSNRRLFQVNMEEAIRRAKQKNIMLALFYIDLDNFKTANDTYGHEAGDFILQTVTYRLNVFFRKEDIISRLGGDELGILVEDFRSREDLKTMARKICQIIAMPIEMQNATLHVSASIGIGIFPEDGGTSEELIAIADRCMYYVKEHGGNGFHSRSGIEA